MRPSRALARQMIGRALGAGVPAAWVAGEEVYGADPALRADLQVGDAGLCQLSLG